MTPQWTKLKNRYFDDGRIKILRSRPQGNDFALIYTMIQSLAGECNCGGALCIDETIPYTAESLAREFDYKKSVIKKAILALEETHLIEVSDGVIYLSDWEADQSAEKLEEIRKKHREAQSRYREKQKSISEKTQKVTSPLCHSDCTEEEKEIKKEKEKELEEDGIYESVKDRFNLTAATGQKILVFSDKQKKAVKTAVDRFGEEMLYDCFRLAGESEFLQGKNPKNWVPTFDWLINPDNISKVLNGNYNTLYSSAASSAPQIDPSVSSFDEDEFIEAALNRPWE